MKSIENMENFELFPWNAHFEVGIACLDEQHKELLRLINLAAWKLITESHSPDLVSSISELLDYARFHFETEEVLWQKYLGQTTLFKNHHHLHEDFFKQIEKFARVESEGKWDTEWLFTFLTNWLIVHILQSDRYFASIISEMEKFGYSLPEAQAKAKIGFLAANDVHNTLVQLYNKLCESALQLNRETQARILAEEQIHNLIKDQAQKELERQAQEYQEQLEFLAYNDPLTGTLNRNGILQQLANQLAQTDSTFQGAVISIDLDDFSRNNTQVGVEGGDRILGMLAKRWIDAMMPGGFIGRTGGDEFIVVVRNQAQVANQISALRLCLKREFVIDHWRVLLDFTAGIYCENQNSEAEDQDAEGCLRCADYALYLAKRENKGGERFFDSSEEQNRHIRIHQIKRIQSALSQDELRLFYQPKVNMRSGEIIGVEALLRWFHPSAGLRAPGQFLPYLEGHPLMIDIGEWAINTALSQLEEWDTSGIALNVSVNIDTVQLQHPDFPSKLQKILTAHPLIAPQRLQLEVLETVAIQDIAIAVQHIEKCRKLGVTFSLDDFGKGYCSLAYLRQLPVDTIKIDQAFVIDMFRFPNNLSILEGMVALARTFDLRIIAEGVETTMHGKYLIHLGCINAQGYEIAKPMPGANIPEWVQQWKPDLNWSESMFLRRDDIPALIALVEIEREIEKRTIQTEEISPDHSAFFNKKLEIWLQKIKENEDTIAPEARETLFLVYGQLRTLLNQSDAQEGVYDSAKDLHARLAESISSLIENKVSFRSL